MYRQQGVTEQTRMWQELSGEDVSKIWSSAEAAKAIEEAAKVNQLRRALWIAYKYDQTLSSLQEKSQTSENLQWDSWTVF